MVYSFDHWSVACLGKLVNIYCKLLSHAWILSENGIVLCGPAPNRFICNLIFPYRNALQSTYRIKTDFDIRRFSLTRNGLDMLDGKESNMVYLAVLHRIWGWKRTYVLVSPCSRMESFTWQERTCKWSDNLWIWVWWFYLWNDYKQTL